MSELCDRYAHNSLDAAQVEKGRLEQRDPNSKFDIYHCEQCSLYHIKVVPPKHRFFSCEGKHAHHSKKAAKKEKKRLMKQYPKTRFSLYECLHCPFYHVGSTA